MFKYVVVWTLLIGSFSLQKSIVAQQADHPVISEIRYHQHAGINDEFVELYNPTDSVVSLEGWKLMYKKKEGGSWITKETMTSEHLIPACGFFLWGGDACEITPDIIETSSSAVGLSNSGGHIALWNTAEEVVDLVAWEGGDSPEDSAVSGETEEGGSLERKASEHSTAESMASGGEEENHGNSYDTNHNANDFVTHTDLEANPQNTLSDSEMPPNHEDGTGSAEISPPEVGLSDTVDIRIAIMGHSNCILDQVAVVVPDGWEWSMQAEDIQLEGNGFLSSYAEIAGDTLKILNASITATDTGIVTISSIVSPAFPETSVFVILTAGAEGTLETIHTPPFIEVKQFLFSIIDLHQNDAMGELAAPFAKGREVIVSGVITAGSNTFSMIQTEVYIQDQTGGIHLFSHDMPKVFATGDSVRVTGTMDQYKGMTEIIPDFDRTWIYSSGHVIPEPLPLTCAEVNATFQSDYSEPNEGRLIRINRVTYDAGNAAITDATGSTMLYIDPDTHIPEPAGTFDIIGILKQYAVGNPPYDYGYEIVPRNTSDILPCGGPQIISGPEVVEWSQNGVTVYWETDESANSILHYGNMSSYGDSIVHEDLVTQHWIDIEGLTPASIYHYWIGSENSGGRNLSGDHLFITASDLSSTGEIHVYFNGSVIDSIAGENEALGDQDLVDLLIQRIQKTKYSIDACFMNLTEWDLRDALISAHIDSGVRVRFICDDLYYNDPEIQALIDAGIPVISDAYGDNDGEGIMHNKFAVFDHRDNTSYSDDWLWTGSFNLSYHGTYPAPKENVIEIQDQALAEIYMQEFEEMWGSQNEIPDPVLSRFGYRKSNNTPTTLAINGIKMHSCMSPNGGTAQRIMQTIQNAEKSLYFCIFSFTHDGIGLKMEEKLSGDPDFRLRGVFDEEQKESDGWASEWERLSILPSADVLLDGETGLLHHKYLIADGDGNGSDPVVITGSHNWSTRAETVNDENTLIIHDADIANQYLQEFAARYYAAGGEEIITSVQINDQGQLPSDFKLFQNYPNPFNSSTRIRYAVSHDSKVKLSIYDLRGRLVKELGCGQQDSVNRSLLWNGTDSSDRAVPSGIYIVRLKDRNRMMTRKVVLMK